MTPPDLPVDNPLTDGIDDAVYQAAVTALFARRPERMLPGLERIEALMARLQHPQRAAPAVHLTGTNGKSTLARMISSLLSAHGVLAGTYTSPHLQDVRERIRVGGRPIRRADLLHDLAELEPHLDAVEVARGEMVTFFETLTALAYQRFATAQVQASVVEVGMGGRWDATNVVEAEVAVINPVRLDHAELGSTVADVAGEKAGIISPGATCVVAEQDQAAARVIEAEARAQGATQLLAGRDFDVAARRPHDSGQELTLRAAGRTIAGVELPLLGSHQADNAAVALAATAALLGRVDAEAVQAGFAAVESPGRLEVVPPARAGQPPVLLDGAHNPAGAAALASALEADFGTRRRVLVLAAMGDKDCAGIVEALLPVADAIVVTEAPTGRSAPADRLGKLCRLAGRQAEVQPDPVAALTRAGQLAGDQAIVVVTGSLYLVGAAREALGLGVV